MRTARIKKNTFVFTSFSGHYSDNPKYISEELHRQCPNAKIIWLVSKENIKILPSYVKGYIIGTQEADMLQASAEVIIDNVYGDRAYTSTKKSFSEMFKKVFFQFCYGKKQQKIFTTWHGTPLKCMGRDQVGSEVSDFVCGNIHMVLGNSFTAQKMKHLTFDKIPMKVIGTPRNDILFSDKTQIKKIRCKLGLPIDKKIVLFAPTFRNDGKDVEDKNIARSGLDQLNEIDLDKLFQTLTAKFDGDWIMICRFHYHVEELVNWEVLESKYSGRIVNGNLHDDMAEYLACTDVLITDASSSMFDFSLTMKPCFLYFPDLDNYEKKERGFYLTPSSLPFPISKTAKSLYESIESFDGKKYISSIKSMHKKLGFVDSPNSSQKVVEFILKRCKL